MRTNKIMWSGLLGAGALLATLATPASADMLPKGGVLQGECLYAAPSCADNGTITPIYGTTSPDFYFRHTSSPNKAEDFLLDVLIPDNVLGATTESITINGTNTGNSSVTGSLFSATEWDSGKLAQYLGFGKVNPANPLNAYTGSTDQVDPGAKGYYVYTFDFGNVNFRKANPMFSESFSFPVGTVITAFAEVCTTPKPKGSCTYTGTANSTALLIACPSCTVHQVPEPLSLSLFGVGLLGMGALSRRRKACKSA